MKQHNNFDDFLRSKEEEFNIPFKEEYWDKASAYLDANRISFWSKFFHSPLWWGSALTVLIGGGALLWYLTNDSSRTNQYNTDLVQQTVPVPNNELNQRTLITGKNELNEVNSTASQLNSGNEKLQSETSVNTIKGTETTSAILSQHHNNSVKVNSKISTTKNFSDSQDLISKNIKQTRSHIDAFILQVKDFKYFKSYGIPSIPVFEEMTIDDKTIPVYYGLPYLGKVQGSSSHKIREFSRGGLYPQLSVSLAGGVNIFNSFKEKKDTSGFISTNPFIGVRASYQLNTKWGTTAQLNLIQRGMLNQRIHQNENTQDDKLIRQFYAVQLPISISYFVNKKHSISLGASPMFTLFAAESTFNKDKNEMNRNVSLSAPKGLNRIDFQAMASYSYRVNKSISLYGSYQYGLIDVTQSNVFTNNLHHTNNFVTIGLCYNLMQKKVSLR